MLYTKCPACGVPLRKATGNMSVCPKCYRGFRSCETSLNVSAAPAGTTAQPVRAANDNETANRAKPRIIAGLVSAIFLVSMTGTIEVLPFVMILVMLIVGVCVKDFTIEDSFIDPVTDPVKAPLAIPAASGAKFRNTTDYLNQFRTLPLASMPLGRLGSEAVQQIRQLEAKQQALRELLGTNHPFEKNSQEAAKYVLANCKQILFRLRYCDQTDPALCRVHAEYIQLRLQENARVLRDFEKLIIEVTQMNDDQPVHEPCLDVLAETLRSIRTQDGTLPQQQLLQRMMR